MALKVTMEAELAGRGEYIDRYYAQVNDWFFELRVPKGTEMTTVDVRFQFPDKQQKTRKMELK